MCTLFKRQVEHRPVEQILINTSREETRVAILDDGLLQDLFIERACARGLVGNVYWGQVVRVLPGMQSAFLDVGLERTAFLHIAEIEGARMDTGTFKPIESLLHEGQRLMVQVAKDPIGTKGARLTTTISLAGRKLVYLPNDSHIGVSQRIEDAALREELRTLATTVRQRMKRAVISFGRALKKGRQNRNSFLTWLIWLGCGMAFVIGHRKSRSRHCCIKI